MYIYIKYMYIYIYHSWMTVTRTMHIPSPFRGKSVLSVCKVFICSHFSLRSDTIHGTNRHFCSLSSP